MSGNEPQKELSAEEQARMEHFKERLQQEKRIADRMALMKHKILVASGKGGVGKTTAAVNLALAFAQAGERVALLDADIHGPGVPFALGMKEVQPTGSEHALNPVEFDAYLAVMSMAFLLPGDADAVIWRGPLKSTMIDNFLADVNWGDREWFVIDTPPGTGDEILSLAQRMKTVDGLIMVTTPQAAAVSSAKKSLSFARKMNLPILGVVENMGPFPCPDCGRQIHLFGGASGGRKVAEEFGVPFLGSVPFDPEVAAAADEGRPALLSRPQGAASDAWRAVAAAVREAVIEKSAASGG